MSEERLCKQLDNVSEKQKQLSWHFREIISYDFTHCFGSSTQNRIESDKCSNTQCLQAF